LHRQRRKSTDNTDLTDPGQCARAGLQPNIDPSNATAPFVPALFPYDLSRGGIFSPYHATANINQFAAYLNDSITAGRFVFTLGFRFDTMTVSSRKPAPSPA